MDLEESYLLETLQLGNRNAFWELWEQHRDHLYGVCLRQMSGIHADADDAASRTMMVAWEKLPRSAGEILNLKAWLTRLGCNVCIDMHRERARVTRAVTAFTTVWRIGTHPGTRELPSPERQYLSGEACKRIRDAIAELPQALREAAEMRFLQEQSYEAIAARMDVTEANARKRVQQAREQLALKLGKAITVRCTRVRA